MKAVGVIIRMTSWLRERDRLLGIRCAVFVDEQGFPAELESDEADLCAWHVLAEVEGTPVATARCSVDGQIGRLAVLPGFRRRGIGGALLQALVREAGAQGIDRFYLNAQAPTLRFYSRYRFVATGPRFMDHGIEHCRMEYSKET
jgi:predicted GNAT family N-acyltransferase